MLALMHLQVGGGLIVRITQLAIDTACTTHRHMHLWGGVVAGLDVHSASPAAEHLHVTSQSQVLDVPVDGTPFMNMLLWVMGEHWILASTLYPSEFGPLEMAGYSCPGIV